MGALWGPNSSIKCQVGQLNGKPGSFIYVFWGSCANLGLAAVWGSRPCYFRSGGANSQGDRLLPGSGHLSPCCARFWPEEPGPGAGTGARGFPSGGAQPGTSLAHALICKKQAARPLGNAHTDCPGRHHVRPARRTVVHTPGSRKASLLV